MASIEQSALDPDIWDPNTWDAHFTAQDAEECRIYLDNDGRHYALIDRLDYEWVKEYRWCPKKDAGQLYARRAVGETAFGVRLRTYTLYLHIEIMKKTGKRRPTARHCLVDHRDGNALNCKRSNLRWATYSMNNFNRWSMRPSDLIEG